MDTKHLDHSELGMLRSTFFGTVDTERKRLKVCLISTFALGLIAHGFGLVNLLLNHDSLWEFYMIFSRTVKIGSGRFLEPVLRYLMGEIVTLPWVTGLMGLLFAGLAVHLISKMFSLDTVWENVLLSGICITNATITSLIAAYIHDFCGDMLALLLSAGAAYAWSRMKQGFSWKYVLLGILCLGASFAFYQTYLSVMITLLCLDTIIELLKGARAKTAVKNLLRAIPIGVPAVAGYFVCSLVLRKMFHVVPGEAYDMANMSRQLVRFDEVVRAGYRYAMADLFRPNYGEKLLVGPAQAVFQPTAVLICLLNVVLLILCLSIVLAAFRKKKVKGGELALILVMILLLPACMMCVSIATSWLHHLVRYAVCLYYLFALLIFKYGRENGILKPAGWRRTLVIGAIGLVIFSNIQIANVAYEKKELEQQATMSVMTRVLSRLEQYEDYTYNESTVAIIGQVNGSGIPLEVGPIDQITGLNFSSQITDRDKIGSYFDIVLQYPIALCTAEQEAEIIATEAFQKMGSFPEKDSIATINGIVVVKMSDPPQW